MNREKAIVGAFSLIVKTDCETDGALHSSTHTHCPCFPVSTAHPRRYCRLFKCQFVRLLVCKKWRSLGFHNPGRHVQHFKSVLCCEHCIVTTHNILAVPNTGQKTAVWIFKILKCLHVSLQRSLLSRRWFLCSEAALWALPLHFLCLDTFNIGTKVSLAGDRWIRSCEECLVLP